MKILYVKILIVCTVGIFYSSSITGQDIIIEDTVYNISKIELADNSSFVVDGEVIGLQNGNIKISLERDIVANVPVQDGKFFFSGKVKSLCQIHVAIDGDYYDNTFYLQPGRISIKYIYQKKFIASGTYENDLNNFFTDTLNNKNDKRFYELNANIELALKDANFELYLRLIDSIAEVEKCFFQSLNDAINQKRIGFYLLPYINYYYINYGYFSEREQIFDRFPENIKQSDLGKKTLAFLNQTKMKGLAINNGPAYWFKLKTASGSTVNLQAFKGKIIVLDFWASWCLPCIATLPTLKKIQQSKVSQDVVFISVSIDKKINDWNKKEKELKIPWLSLLADDATIKEYAINAVPSYIIITQDGMIAEKTTTLNMLYSTLKALKK